MFYDDITDETLVTDEQLERIRDQVKEELEKRGTTKEHQQAFQKKLNRMSEYEFNKTCREDWGI